MENVMFLSIRITYEYLATAVPGWLKYSDR